MPMTTPSIAKPVRILLSERVPKLSTMSSRASMFGPLSRQLLAAVFAVDIEFTVSNLDDPFGIARDVLLMRDHEYGIAAIVEILENLHNLSCLRAGNVSRWLVCH